MKKFTFTLMLLLAMFSSYSQIWTINQCGGQLASNTFGPMNSIATANASNRSAQIYPASQLTGVAGQNLTAMYFRRLAATGAIAATGANFKIYMRETTATDWGTAALDWSTAITGATLVYDSNPATIIGTTAGMKSFPLIAPFTYSGNQNLAVMFEYSSPTAATAAVTWDYEFTAPCVITTNANSGKYINATTALPLPATSSLATSNARRPIIGFDFTTTCPPPTGAVASSPTATSLTLNWANGGTETQWEYIVVPSTATPPTAASAGTVVTTKPVNATGLLPSTTYRAFVRAVCGAGNNSTWVASNVITTTVACPAPTAAVLTAINGFGATLNWTNGASETQWEYLVLPSAATAPTAASAGTVVTTKPVTFSGLTPVTGYRAYIRANCGAGGVSLWLQSAIFTTTTACPPPTAPIVSGLTSTAVTLTWTAGASESQWEYYLLPATAAVPAAASNTGTVSATSTLSLTGLTPATSYRIHVRSACGATSTSSWVSSAVFSTSCVPADLPWVENFDSLTTVGTTSFPSCWVKQNGDWATANATTYNTARSGTNYIRNSWSAVNEFIWTPTFQLTAGVSYDFTYNAQGDGWTGWILDLFHNSTQTSVGATQIGTTFTAPGPGSLIIQQYTQVKTQFIPTTSGAYTFGIRSNQSVSDPYYIAIDDLRMEVTPTCPAPSALVVSAITNSGASILFTEPTSPPNNGYEYIVTTTNTIPATTATPTGTVFLGISNFDLTGLASGTTYFVWVRSICSASDKSPWSDSATFVTNCADVSSFSQNFDSALTFPTCWKKLGSLGTAVITATGASSAPNALSMNSTNATTRSVVAMPPVNNINSGTHRLRIQARSSVTVGGRLEIGYLTDYFSDASFVAVQSVTTTSVTVYDSFNVILGTTPPAGSFLAFRHPSAPANTVLIDNVFWEPIPTCAEPSLPIASSITASSAVVSFVEPAVPASAGYEYIVSTSNVTPSASATVTGTVGPNTSSFTATALMPATTYFVYVRSNCGSGSVSPWSNSTTFTTLCVAVTAFTQNFDAITSPALPTCWFKVGTVGTVNTQTAGALSASNCLYMFSSSATARAVVSMTPVSNAGANTHWLRFRLRANFTVGGIVEVGYLTNPNSDASFVSVQSFTATSITAYDNYSAILGTAPGSNQTLAFRVTGVPANSILIDNVVWEPQPTCNFPSAFASSAVTANAATISWSSPATPPANGYSYFVSTTNVEPLATATPTGVTASGVTSATLGSLSPSTQYYVWVRSNCSASETSAWSSGITFTTPCLPITSLPWNEGFESVTLPASSADLTLFQTCWSKQNGDWATANQTTYNTANTGANYIRNAWSATNEFMWTPGFQLTAGVSYDFSYFAQGDGFLGWTADLFQNTQQNSTGATQIGGSYSPAGTNAAAIQPYNLVKNSFTPTTSGVYFFGIRVNQPSGAPWYMAFDDFSLALSPPCNNPNAPTAASVTTTSAQVSWNSTAIGNAYQFFVSTTDTAPTAATTPTGSTTANTITTNVTGLTSATTYFVWVRSSCGAGVTSAWSQAGTFTTLCTAVTIPTVLQDFEGTTGTALPTCWSSQLISGTNNWNGNSPIGSFGDITTTNSGTRIVFKDYTDSEALLFSQPISYVGVTAPTRVNVFLHRHMSGAVTDLYRVYVNTSASLTGALLLDTVFSRGATAPAVSATGFYNYVFNIPSSFNGQANVFVIIQGVTDSGFSSYALGVDDFKVELSPSCIQPSAVVSSASSATTASVSWTAPPTAPAVGYQYILSTTNAAPTAASTPTASVAAPATTVSLTGLIASTSYFVWIRSICSASDSSSWTAASTFTTPCAASIPPYVQDFATQPLPCFAFASAGTVAAGPSGTGGIWLEDGFLNNGTTGAMKVNLYSTNRIGWLITPTYDLTGGPFAFTFNYGLTAWNETTPSTMGSDDSVKILMSTNGGTSWTEISQFTVASNIQNVSTPYSYAIPTTAGNNVKFAFLATDGTVDDAEDYDFFIDDLKVQAALSNASFNNSAFKFYPNPVTSILNLSYSSDITKVSVFNLLGQEVITKVVNANSTQIDMSALSQGTYMVRVVADNEVKIVKVLKQ